MSESGSPRRVLVADDHPVVRAGIIAILGPLPRYRVVGEASDGEAAWKAIRSSLPDIAIVDAIMPGLGGLDVVERARREGMDTAFLVLSAAPEGADLERALALEVDAYLLKGSSAEAIVGALDAIADGRRVLPLLADYGNAVRAAPRSASAPPAAAGSDFFRLMNRLTPTERVVLRHLSENKTSRQIASELRVSVRTIQNHRANICEKLAFRGANKLLQFALENRVHLASANTRSPLSS